MPRQRSWQLSSAVLAAVVALSLLVIPATADHWWEPFHWGRTSNPFTLTVHDNVGSAWDQSLANATADWSESSVLTLTTDSTGAIDGKVLKKCPPTPGRVEVCAYRYGGGWLGLAQIWTDGDHITQATVKVNDFYYTRPAYDTLDERQSVLCEELGHTIGLDHRDDGGCLDYSSGSIVHPDDHDYAMLEEIYEHLDSTTTVGSTSAVAAGEELGNEPRNWGEVVRRDERGRPIVYRKDLGRGRQVFTFVIPADDQSVADGGRQDGGNKDGGKQDAAKKGGGKKNK